MRNRSKSPQEDLELRCFCARHPLLAVAGRDENGKGYVHVKTWKGERLYAEMILLDGVCVVRCRSCYRWHRFRIVRSSVESNVSELPDSIQLD